MRKHRRSSENRIRESPLKQDFGVWPSFWLGLCLLALVRFSLVATVKADPLFDTSTPTSFFTNVASRLLAGELNVNLSQLQVYPTNQYTPAVHRLLQVTANIWDAQNTNFYPSVFRPLFAEDASSNIFIIGYQQVTNVSGPADPQLAAPYAAPALLNFPGTTAPIADSNGPVNVYGVPWLLGAKQGLPNFNQLSLVSAAQVTRQLEVTRDSLDSRTAIYGTNQMYIMGISNSLGISFWNSYNAAYPRPLTVFVFDVFSTTITNALYVWTAFTNFTYNFTVNSWPGSQWSGIPPKTTPNPAAFLSFNWGSVFLNPSPYDFTIESHRRPLSAVGRARPNGVGGCCGYQCVQSGLQGPIGLGLGLLEFSDGPNLEPELAGPSASWHTVADHLSEIHEHPRL